MIKIEFNHQSFPLPPDFSQRFPNGELNVDPWFTAKGWTETVRFWWFYEGDQELTELWIKAKSLIASGRKATLTIAYMPYSRMDRDHQGGSNCSLRWVGEMLQSIGFESICVVDPHSELTLAYLGTKSFQVYPWDSLYFLHGWVPSLDKDGLPITGVTHPADPPVIMFPDAGAAKRYGSMKIFKEYTQIVGIKKRDFKTGRITGYDLSGGIDVCDKHVVIVDDLCSYGGTFLAAGNALQVLGANKIDLLVSHCEDSIHNGELLKPESPIDRIFTTNSILSKGHEKIQIHHLENSLK